MAAEPRTALCEKEHTVQKARLRHRAAALLLGMSILSPAAWGAERTGEYNLPQAKTGVVAALLNLWGYLTALWDEEGSYIDPDGGRATSPEPAAPNGDDHQEAGAYIDPNG
jgi:hypothetical protein